MTRDAPTSPQPAQRIQIADRLDALARGIVVVIDGLDTASDDVIREAAGRIRDEAQEIASLAILNAWGDS